MAIRGQLSTDSGDFNYEVVQYWTTDRDRPYVRGAEWDKLDSADFQRATVYVSSPQNPTDGIYINIYGPFLDEDLLVDELEAYIDDAEYGEAIG